MQKGSAMFADAKPKLLSNQKHSSQKSEYTDAQAAD